MQKKNAPGGCNCCAPCDKIPVTSFTLSVGNTAQGGTSTTIQLASSETWADDDINGGTVEITSGTGNGQTRTISDYTGATDTATVSVAWATDPDNTSVYTIRAKDNGDKSFEITNSEATPEQNVASSHEAYQFHVKVDDDCTINVEGFAIVVSVTNQTITLDGNTENWANATEVGGEPVELHVYVCPDFVYVAALRSVFQANYDFWTGGSPFVGDYVAMGAENGTALIADFATPPYSIVPDWTVETTGTVTMSPVTDLTDIEVWPETFECDVSDVITTDCSRGPRRVAQHYGFMVASADLDAALSGFEYLYHVALSSFFGTWTETQPQRWNNHRNNDNTAVDRFYKPELPDGVGNVDIFYTMHWTAVWQGHVETGPLSPATRWIPDRSFRPVSIGSLIDFLDIKYGQFGNIADNILSNPSTVSAPHGRLDQATFVYIHVDWEVDDPSCADPYPRPKFVATNEIVEDGLCYDVSGNVVSPLLESWSRDGITSSDIAINDLTAGFTLATSTTWSGCSGAYGGSTQQFTGVGMDSSSQVTTVTWTV